MNLDVVDIKGKKIKEIELSDSVLKIVPNKEAIAQYIRVYLTNQRQGTVSTKTRAEVSGGGKKPWQQKHTGRARHGSTRSPIWVGGGVSFGPKPRDWRLSLPKKIRSLAIRSALAQRILDKAILCIEEIPVKTSKTKDIYKELQPIISNRKNLIVWLNKNEQLMQAVSNIQNVAFTDVKTLNAYELLNTSKIIVFEDALNYLNEKYQDESK